jgi:hypothetical protein
VTWIAERRVVLVFADGQRVAGRIAIGQPRMVSDHEGKCDLWLEGLDKVRAISGNGTLQPLLLALRNAGAQLDGFLRQGGRLLDPDTDEEIDLELTFGPLLAPP